MARGHGIIIVVVPRLQRLGSLLMITTGVVAPPASHLFQIQPLFTIARHPATGFVLDDPDRQARSRWWQ